MNDIENTIKEFYEKGASIKVIIRTVNKGSNFVRAIIKKLGLKRRHILKKYKYRRFCKRCNKEIERADVTWFCSMKCFHLYKYESYIKKWLQGEVSGCNGRDGENVSNHVRRWLFEKNNNSCEKCGWRQKNETTGKIPLTVNHKNGDWQNSSVKNIELICPNCHSLTPNYGSLNRGYGRPSRIKR